MADPTGFSPAGQRDGVDLTHHEQFRRSHRLRNPGCVREARHGRAWGVMVEYGNAGLIPLF